MYIRVPDETGDIFGLELLGLKALPRKDETKVQISVREVEDVEQSAKVRILKVHGRELKNENSSLKQHLIVLNVKKVRCKARKLDNKKAIMEWKVQLANVKIAIHVLEEPQPEDRLLMHGAIEDHKPVDNKPTTDFAWRKAADKELATAYAKGWTVEQELTAGFDQLL